MATKGLWKGRPIEELTREELENALLEMGALHSTTLEEVQKTVDNDGIYEYRMGETNLEPIVNLLHRMYGSNVFIGPLALANKISRGKIDQLVDAGYLRRQLDGWYLFRRSGGLSKS